MDKSENFDRERILDWLLSIPSPAAHDQPPKPDGGLTSSPDSQVVHNTSSPLKHHYQQQQQQQKYHQYQHPFPSPHQHRRTVPNIFSPLVQWRGASPRSMSIACMGTLPASRPGTAATPQQSFHRRQKSESPLPDASVAAELPTFAMLSPVLPQRKRLSQTPRPERCVATFDTPRSDAPPVATDVTTASVLEGCSLTSQVVRNSPANIPRNSPTSSRNSPTSPRNSPTSTAISRNSQTSQALSRNSPTSPAVSRNSPTGPSVTADSGAVICPLPAASSPFGRHTHKSSSVLLPGNKLGKIVAKDSPNATSDAVTQGEPALPLKVQGSHTEIRVAISPPTSPSSLGRDWSIQGSDLIHPWSPLAFSDSDTERAVEYWSEKPVGEIVPPPTLADNQYASVCSKNILTPSPLPVSPTNKTTRTTSATLTMPRGAGASSGRVGIPSTDLVGGERVEETLPALRPTELAALSLLVGDTLPQLVLFLGMEYSEYERIVSEEPSSQRQSLRFLMKWFYSTSGSSQREVLVDALHKCGHSIEAQQLLSGELEEFGQKQYLYFGSPENYKRSYTFVPSPLPLSSTPPLSQPQLHQHGRSSPSVLTSPPPLPPSLPSAASKEPIPHFSPSLITTQPPNEEKELPPYKHMFTFDEEKIDNSLPKFLSNWSFEKTPEYPSHLHHHPHTPHPSQGVLRRKSCSDKPHVHSATPNPRDASLLTNQLAGKRGQQHCGISESAKLQTSRYASTGFVVDLNRLKNREQYGRSVIDTTPRFASGVSNTPLSFVGGVRDSTQLSDNLRFHTTTRPPMSLSDSTLHCASSGKGIMEGMSGREAEKALAVGRRGKLARQDSGIETLYSTI